MSRSSLREALLKELDGLPEKLQQQVLDYARSLTANAPQGVSGEKLARFARTLTPEAAQEMSDVIEADCEKVDLNDW